MNINKTNLKILSASTPLIFRRKSRVPSEKLKILIRIWRMRSLRNLFKLRCDLADEITSVVRPQQLTRLAMWCLHMTKVIVIMPEINLTWPRQKFTITKPPTIQCHQTFFSSKSIWINSQIVKKEENQKISVRAELCIQWQSEHLGQKLQKYVWTAMPICGPRYLIVIIKHDFPWLIKITALQWKNKNIQNRPLIVRFTQGVVVLTKIIRHMIRL